MKIRFASSVAAAAAAGLMGVACGESTPESEVPATPNSPNAEGAMDEAGGGATDEAGDESAGADGEQAACCKGMNECSGKGGCKTDAHDCQGKNECRGKGGCNKHCPASEG